MKESSRRGLRSRVALSFLALSLLGFLAACGSRTDNSVGVALVEDQGELQAVQLVELFGPDSSADFQILEAPENVGTSTVLLVSGRPGLLGRTLVRFDSTAFPDSGAPVDSAFLNLPFTGWFGDPSLSMTIHRVTSPWEEGRILPDSFPMFGAALETLEVVFPEEDTELDTATVRLDELARFWIDAPDSNFGLMLAPLDGATQEIEIVSEESSTAPLTFQVFHSAGSSVTPTIEDDTYALETTTGFMPQSGFPQRLTIGRGLPVRSQLKFDVPDLGARATINRAELVLRVDAANSSLNDFTFGLQRITGPWQADSTDVESLLWGSTTASADSDTLTLQITTVIDLLQSDEDFGFQLRALDETGDTDFFRVFGADAADSTLVPRLRIWYTPGNDGETP